MGSHDVRYREKQTKQLLIVENDEAFKDRLKRFLMGREGVMIEFVDDVRVAMDRDQMEPPDLLIMDVDQMSLDQYILPFGHTLCPVLVLSNQESEEFLEKIIQSGAMGFLPKRADKELFIEAIDRMLKYKVFLPLKEIRLLIDEITNLKLICLKRRASLRLSHREFEVYQLMIQGKTNNEISQELYISIYTVKHHVHHIQKRLGVRNRTDAVTLAYRRGWVIHWVMDQER